MCLFEGMSCAFRKSQSSASLNMRVRERVVCYRSPNSEVHIFSYFFYFFLFTNFEVYFYTLGTSNLNLKVSIHINEIVLILCPTSDDRWTTSLLLCASASVLYTTPYIVISGQPQWIVK